MNGDNGSTRRDPRARASEFQQRRDEGREERPDEGRIFAREKRRDGTEFRVSLHTFRGSTFVRVAAWQLGADRKHWWPVRDKGMTVKLSEIGAAVTGLCDAMDVLEGRAPAPRVDAMARATNDDDDAAPGDGPAQTQNDDMEGF